MTEIEKEILEAGEVAMVDPVTGRTTVMLTGVEVAMEAVPRVSIMHPEDHLTQEVPEMGSTDLVGAEAAIVVMHTVLALAVDGIAWTPRVRIEHKWWTGAEIEQETEGQGGALHHLSVEGQPTSHFKQHLRISHRISSSWQLRRTPPPIRGHKIFSDGGRY